jgi:hypothetical protein
MVFLYNRLGDCLWFSSAGWNEVLENAGIFGWKAKGTMPPPASIDLASVSSETITWDGNYTRPLGQSVAPDDASALAAAVERASASGAVWTANRRSALRAFASFCQQRGFLVSSNRFVNPPAKAVPMVVRYKLAS